MPAITKKPQTAPAEDTREVKYPVITCCGVEVPLENTVITLDLVKEISGGEKVIDDSHTFTLPNGDRIRFNNNGSNRPFEDGRAEQYAQDLLNKQWSGPHGNGKTINGEACTIGRMGTMLSCQHRFAAVWLANWKWENELAEDGTRKWADKWPEAPVMDSIIIFGVDESPETTQTIDNVKARTSADVFYSDPSIFPDEKRGPRKSMCAALDYAVKLVWHRSGEKNDVYSPTRTHSEAKEFLKTHPSIFKCVKHIYEEDGDGHAINGLVRIGTASGLLYLMMCAKSESEDYDGTEESLNTSLWKKAASFWTELGKGEGGFKLIRKAISDLTDEELITSKIREALVVKAWLVYSADLPMTDHQLEYSYKTLKDGSKRFDYNGTSYLIEVPSCGGIDLGDPDEARREAEAVSRAAKKEAEQKIKDAEKELKAVEREAARKKAPVESPSQVISRIKEEIGVANILLFTRPGQPGVYDVAGGDALTVAKKLGRTASVHSETKLQFLQINKEEADKLLAQDYALAVCGPEEGNPSHKIYLGQLHADGSWTPPSSPKPAAPLPKTGSKKPEPAKPAPKPAAKPASTPAKKPAGKPALRGGK